MPVAMEVRTLRADSARRKYALPQWPSVYRTAAVTANDWEWTIATMAIGGAQAILGVAPHEAYRSDAGDGDKRVEDNGRRDPERYESRNALAQHHLSGHYALVARTRGLSG